MTSSSLGYASSANLGFSFQTSSGDKIDLQLYSKKELGYEKSEDSESLMFAAKEGYKFRFETNGLSDQDKTEIAEAMKKIEPMINKFMEENGSETFLKEPLDIVAANINNALPKPKDENAKNALSASTVGLFDNLFQKSKAPKDIFDDMQKLLDKILKNIQNPQTILYA